MKILIIEDEAPASRRLCKLVKDIDQNITVVGIIQSVKEGLEWFAENPAPDLILSDIQLADDLSFRIFSELKITTPVIFTTAYDEYALNAFKFHSIDYLLKPIKQEDLQNSIEKFKSFKTNHIQPDYEKLFKNLGSKEYRSRFLVYAADSLIPISINEIAYFASEDGETMLFVDSGKHYFINDSLDQLEEELDPKLFFRANRQLIVSLKSIEKISPFGLQKLKIDLRPEYDKPVMVSKLKVTAFKNWLDS